MSARWSKKRLIGLILNLLVGCLMLVIGSAKLLGMAPAERVETMGLTETVRLVGAGEIVTAILLLIPRTLSLGILLASSFWGGAICAHMTRGEPYVLQSALLVTCWIGAYLRNSAVLASFHGHKTCANVAATIPLRAHSANA